MWHRLPGPTEGNLTALHTFVGTTAGASTTRYYLSLDPVKGAGDTLLTGARAVTSIADGGTNTGSRTVNVPGATALATYYLHRRAVKAHDDESCRAIARDVDRKR